MIAIGVASPSAQGARNDQHGNGAHQRQCQPRLGPPQTPADERHDCNRNHGGHEISRQPVGEPLYRRTTALCLAHHADNLRQHRFAAHPISAYHETPGPVDRGSDDRIIDDLFNRNWFAGDHRFVHGATSFDHDAVHRNPIAGTHAEGVTNANLR